MSRIMQDHHELTGLPLPQKWRNLTFNQREAVCRWLRMPGPVQAVTGYTAGRDIWWAHFNGEEKREIRKHLEAIGSIPIKIVPYTTFASPRGHGKSHVQSMVRAAYERADKAVDTYRANHPDPIRIWFDEATNFKPTMLYDRPNGGKRSLPSVYGRLNGNLWLRANGVIQPIKTMNDGHLENTLKLLQESHGNIVEKSTSLLGKMHRHYQHQSEIQRRLEELCFLMQKVEVHEMYPIFGTLAQEQASRKRCDIVVGVDFSAFDDALKDW